eukprot:222587-Prorocentrum_minimum.AAC.1
MSGRLVPARITTPAPGVSNCQSHRARCQPASQSQRARCQHGPPHGHSPNARRQGRLSLESTP